MRKWVTFGFVIVLIFVPLLFVSQPKKGSVEWHKREYLRARNGPSTSEQIRRTIGRIMGRSYSFGISDEQQARMTRHQSALIDLGFLEERNVIVTNLADIPVVKHLQYNISQEVAAIVPSNRMVFTTFAIGSATNLRVIAVREDMQVWEDAIRKAYASE